jgi:hypothetical protein
VVSKVTWPEFSEIFRSKENLAKRFDQLATLRNGIRHSRAISEITLKEGEAALLWFRQILNAATQGPDAVDGLDVSGLAGSE